MALHRTAGRLAASGGYPQSADRFRPVPDSAWPDPFHWAGPAGHSAPAITRMGALVTVTAVAEVRTPAYTARPGPATAPSVLPWPAELPDLEAWTRRLAQAIAEMLAGARSPSQLHGVATLEVVRLIERRYGRFSAAAGAVQVRPIVRSVHIARPQPLAAEACAIIATGHRVRAIALRIELVDRGWRCTAVQVG